MFPLGAFPRRWPGQRSGRANPRLGRFKAPFPALVFCLPLGLVALVDLAALPLLPLSFSGLLLVQLAASLFVAAYYSGYYSGAARRLEEAVKEVQLGKRPAEELYDMKKDPQDIKNVASDPAYVKARAEMRTQLDRWMHDTADPRATKDDDHWDKYPYFGGGGGK